MYGHVRAMCQRPAKVGRSKSIVDDQTRANRSGNPGTGVDITNLQQWVRNGFREENARLELVCFRAYRIKLTEIRRNGFDSETTENGLEQIRGRAVEILRSKNRRPGR